MVWIDKNTLSKLDPKSPFKHSNTIYVFTSGRVIIVTVPIHSRKKILKGVKMTTAKSPSIQERTIVLQDLMKRGVCRRAEETTSSKPSCFTSFDVPKKLDKVIYVIIHYVRSIV
jgi:hypothetical protein